MVIDLGLDQMMELAGCMTLGLVTNFRFISHMVMVRTYLSPPLHSQSLGDFFSLAMQATTLVTFGILSWER